ncbi:WD-40 repeat-containing protein MSI4 [Carex littledalei]|uniref:WD-40 repeat-containing protein MSI4 n=1 Tax=Carex littledalei TaxID=544730 RepID=A0A833R140_9POAL|nr:WD-40 repeat-containing protein MSI4 [Carex littledalei]
MWSLKDTGTILELSSSKLTPRRVFRGHDATVVDIKFRPSSTQEFCSVSDDSCLILWDARSGNAPVVKVEKAHDGYLKCVDWNAQNEDLILTGSADQTVRLFDRRNLTAGGVASPIRKFEGHVAPVTTVQA